MDPPLWPGLLRAGDRALVLVSGGPDSLCLLHLLVTRRRETGLEVEAFHLHHGLRGAAADADVAFLERTAADLGVSLTVERADIPALAREQHLGIEAAGRQARYEAAERVARSRGCNRVATAHTADDQAETTLMRVLRGTGLEGLGGMRPARPLGGDSRGPTLVRPLLAWSRPEVLEYCRRYRLTPREDATNADCSFLRNRLRSELLPLLERDYNPALRARLLSLAEQVREASEWLDECAGEALTSARLPTGALSVEALNALPPAVRHRALTLALREAAPGIELTFRLVRRLAGLLSPAGPRAVTLPGAAVRVARAGEAIVFEREAAPDATPEPLPFGEDGVEWSPPRCVIRREAVAPPANPRAPATVAYLDADAVIGALRVRGARRGERFRPLGAPGRMKLSDFFINRKLPRGRRTAWPLVCDDAGPLWIVGKAISERARLTDSTRRCLRLTVAFREPLPEIERN